MLRSQHIALLKTCRQIYIEVIEVLYSTNTSDINILDTMIYLSRTIRPQHLSTTTSLHISWECSCLPSPSSTKWYTSDPPYDLKNMETPLSIVITQMSALLDLRLRLHPTRHYPSTTAGSAIAALQPLLDIRELRSFELDLTYPGVESDAQLPLEVIAFR